MNDFSMSISEKSALQTARSKPAVVFENVTKIYNKNERPALDGVSLDIQKGEFAFLVGASGSGKSSILKLLLQEEKITSGRIEALGADIGKLPAWKVPALRRNIGYVFQDFKLLPEKNVFKNVSFALEVIHTPKKETRERVMHILELVGLSDKQNRMPSEISGGEQQRVAVARAFVNNPLLLLADEPTGNLDPKTSEGIMELLAFINQTGTSVIMATHDAGIVDAMGKKVVYLENGKILGTSLLGTYKNEHQKEVKP